jgi:hypothetical protein
MALWISIATDALMGLSHSQERRLWIVIDELPAIKKLPKLQMMLAEIRKYGGCAILGTQDMCQLDEIYGQNIVKSIANLCSTKVVFRIEGAKLLSACPNGWVFKKSQRPWKASPMAHIKCELACSSMNCAKKNQRSMLIG